MEKWRRRTMSYEPINRQECYSIYFCCENPQCEHWGKCTVQAMSEGDLK